MPLLRLVALRVQAHTLNVEINPAERLALVGVGLGPVLRAIALMHKVDGGKIFFEDKEITTYSARQVRPLRKQLQFVGGNPQQTLLPQYSVEATLIEPLQIHRVGSAVENRSRAATIAAQMGLNPLLLQMPVGSLSAALRQRVALGRALMLRPQLLITDALTDHLDPAVERPILTQVARICRAQHTAWIFATKNPALAQSFADRVLDLAHEKINS